MAFFSKRESFRDRSGPLPKEGKFAAKIKKAVTLVMLQLPPPAREPTTRIHAPSQPLMQSPLSRNQTPATPRRARRFFRVRPLTRSPRLADHSAYFGSANLFSCQPFRPSTKVRLRPIAFWVNARMLCSEVEKPTLLLKTRQLTPGFTAESPGAPFASSTCSCNRLRCSDLRSNIATRRTGGASAERNLVARQDIRKSSSSADSAFSASRR
jgi:hypothetical protein